MLEANQTLDPATQVATGRMCSRCGQVTNQRWRIGCARCGDLVVTVQTHDQMAKILDRAYYGGWRHGIDNRSASLALARAVTRRGAA
jgi:hypothetical protein